MTCGSHIIQRIEKESYLLTKGYCFKLRFKTKWVSIYLCYRLNIGIAKNGEWATHVAPPLLLQIVYYKRQHEWSREKISGAIDAKENKINLDICNQSVCTFLCENVKNFHLILLKKY